MALAFPGFNIPGLAWIAPALILFSTFGCAPGKQFRLAYLAGLTHYLISLHWLLLIPAGWFPVLGWLALSAFVALYPATWAWLTWKLFPNSEMRNEPEQLVLGDSEQQTKDEASPPDLQNRESVWKQLRRMAKAADGFVHIPLASRMIWALSGAAAWVALEMIISRFLGGFPWNLLGNSQFRMVPIIQISSITGVYGISFLLVWTSLSFLSACMVIIRLPTRRSAWVGEIFIPSVVVACLYGWGYHKLLKPQETTDHLSIALVQPSIPQTMIWNANENATRFQQLLKLSENALERRPQILIWPEAALPAMVRYDAAIRTAVCQMAASNHVWIILGSDDKEPGTQAGEDVYFNSSFLISPTDAGIVDRYCKRKLVIFGEYIPLVKYLPFLKYLTPIDGGFTPGNSVAPFEITAKNRTAKVGILICFEDVFPHLVREYVGDDTDFLVNLTNDGWFGEGAAQWQQGASAVFRAVENGITLVRCSNTGLTCFIDPQGRITEVFRDEKGTIYGAGILSGRAPLLAEGSKRSKTYYTLHGDVFGWACVAWTVLGIARCARKK